MNRRNAIKTTIGALAAVPTVIMASQNVTPKKSNSPPYNFRFICEVGDYDPFLDAPNGPTVIMDIKENTYNQRINFDFHRECFLDACKEHPNDAINYYIINENTKDQYRYECTSNKCWILYKIEGGKQIEKTIAWHVNGKTHKIDNDETVA